MADRDPAADTDEQADEQADVRTTEVYGGQAGDEPVGEGTEEVPTTDEGREGAGPIEQRIEEVKRRAEEMAKDENA